MSRDVEAAWEALSVEADDIEGWWVGEAVDRLIAKHRPLVEAAIVRDFQAFADADRSAIAQEGSPVGLDVERLGWAMHRIRYHGDDGPCYHDRAQHSMTVAAGQVLREYAALGVPDGD